MRMDGFDAVRITGAVSPPSVARTSASVRPSVRIGFAFPARPVLLPFIPSFLRPLPRQSSPRPARSSLLLDYDFVRPQFALQPGSLELEE